MTTKVTIDAHAGWPVKVSIFSTAYGDRIERVEPYTVRDFYVFDTQYIMIKELTNEKS